MNPYTFAGRFPHSQIQVAVLNKIWSLDISEQKHKSDNKYASE